MKKIIFLLFFLIYFLNDPSLHAVETDESGEEELFFTYVGPTLGFGMNSLSYSGWSSDSDKRISKTISGYFVNGGFLCDIFVRNFIGEFTLEYIANFNSGEPDVSVQNMIFTSAVKYSYLLKENFFLTGGLGVYVETPPSDRSYHGGGPNAAIGAIYDFSRDLKLVFDVLFRYGYTNLGDDTTKFSYGAKIGVVYKVGRI